LNINVVLIVGIVNVVMPRVILQSAVVLSLVILNAMRLCHPQDGGTSLKYKLLCFITTKKIAKRRTHKLITGIGAAT